MEQECKYYKAGWCRFDTRCKFKHIETPPSIITKKIPITYGNIYELPLEVLKMILNDVYLSDFLSVCHYLYQIIIEHYPLKLYTLQSEDFHGISIARCKIDAVFNICLRILNCNTVQPICGAERLTEDEEEFGYRLQNKTFSHLCSVKLAEIRNPTFRAFVNKFCSHSYFRKILLKDKEEAKKLLINYCNLYFDILDYSITILPLNQCTSVYYYK